MRLVTIIEAGRELWTGPYREFEQAFFDVLSVAEFCELYQFGEIHLGDRNGYPPRTIRLETVTVH